MRKLNKILLWFFLLVLNLSLVTGCKSKTITILLPTGAPSYGHAYLFNNDQYDIKTVNGADALVSGFNDIGYDLIIAPLNLGAKLYNAKDTYQLIGVITWGNYYLISQNPISMENLENRTIKTFGKNQIPDFILQFIMDSYDVTVTYDYLDSLPTVASSFLLNPEDIYLVAEPTLSILEQKNSLSYIDLNVLYISLTGETGMPQAGVFAHKKLSNQVIEQYKRDIETSISMIKNEASGHQVLKDAGIEIDSSIYISAINRSNISFVDIITIKDEITIFLQRIMMFNPAFLDQLPDASFYRWYA